IQPGAQADAGADRNEHDVAVRHHRHAKAADDIGRAIYAGIALEYHIHRREAVDQHHHLGAVPAEIDADRGTLPEDRVLPLVAGIHRAFAITGSGEDGPARFLTQDIGVGQAELADGPLDQRRETLRDGAEELASARHQV